MAFLTRRRILSTILIFYLAAQLVQQYVLRLGPLSDVAGMEGTIVAGQHPLNVVRLFLVLLSMFLMVAAYLIIGLSFYERNPLLSTLSIIFFIFFCGLEISYRSVELFQVVQVWGKEFVVATASERNEMLPRFAQFNELVRAVYVPLLFSHFAASVCLLLGAAGEPSGRLVVAAMGINSIRLILGLLEYTPFDFLNIFGGAWYFPPVAVVFALLLIWSMIADARR